MVCDEGPAVAMNLHAVGLAAVVRDDLEAARRIDAKDASERDVGAVEDAVPVERRALEERVHVLVLARVGPWTAAVRCAQFIGQAREHDGLEALGWWVH